MSELGRRVATAGVALVLASACSEATPAARPPVTEVSVAAPLPPPEKPVPEAPRAQPTCERSDVAYDDGTSSVEETRFDEHDRVVESYERWVHKDGGVSVREASFTYGADGRLLTMSQRDRGEDDGHTTYETGSDMKFEHGPHGEIVAQIATGSQRTTTLEWDGTFRAGAPVKRPRQPWDRPLMFSLSLPQDLTLREPRASMPPFVFEGTVTTTSEKYGVENVVTYDKNGRMTKHQAIVGRFEQQHEYDLQGLLVKTTSDDGRVTTFRYQGLAGVGQTFSGGRDGGAVVVYERDSSGRLVSGKYESPNARIVTTYGPCQKLKRG